MARIFWVALCLPVFTCIATISATPAIAGLKYSALLLLFKKDLYDFDTSNFYRLFSCCLSKYRRKKASLKRMYLMLVDSARSDFRRVFECHMLDITNVRKILEKRALFSDVLRNISAELKMYYEDSILNSLQNCESEMTRLGVPFKEDMSLLLEELQKYDLSEDRLAIIDELSHMLIELVGVQNRVGWGKLVEKLFYQAYDPHYDYDDFIFHEQYSDEVRPFSMEEIRLYLENISHLQKMLWQGYGNILEFFIAIKVRGGNAPFPRIMRMVSYSSGGCKEICPICLEQLKVHSDKVVLTHCRHLFHRSCICESFKVKHDCPSCRKLLDDDTLLTLIIDSDLRMLLCMAFSLHLSPNEVIVCTRKVTRIFNSLLLMRIHSMAARAKTFSFLELELSEVVEQKVYNKYLKSFFRSTFYETLEFWSLNTAKIFRQYLHKPLYTEELKALADQIISSTLSQQ